MPELPWCRPRYRHGRLHIRQGAPPRQYIAGWLRCGRNDLCVVVAPEILRKRRQFNTRGLFGCQTTVCPVAENVNKDRVSRSQVAGPVRVTIVRPGLHSAFEARGRPTLRLPNQKRADDGPYTHSAEKPGSAPGPALLSFQCSETDGAVCEILCQPGAVHARENHRLTGSSSRRARGCDRSWPRPAIRHDVAELSR